jgi:hypothetical protein
MLSKGSSIALWSAALAIAPSASSRPRPLTDALVQTPATGHGQLNSERSPTATQQVGLGFGVGGRW